MVLNFWAPTIIQRAGVSNLLHIGLLSAVPYTIGAVVMLALCYHSDRRLERRWHFFAAVFSAACAALAMAYASSDWALAIICLSVLAIGYLSAIALFWTIPAGFLSEAEYAGSIALISSAGQIGSMIATVLFGYVFGLTGDLTLGAGLVALVLFAGGCSVLSLKSSGPPQA